MDVIVRRKNLVSEKYRSLSSYLFFFWLSCFLLFCLLLFKEIIGSHAITRNTIEKPLSTCLVSSNSNTLQNYYIYHVYYTHIYVICVHIYIHICTYHEYICICMYAFIDITYWCHTYIYIIYTYIDITSRISIWYNPLWFYSNISYFNI